MSRGGLRWMRVKRGKNNKNIREITEIDAVSGPTLGRKTVSFLRWP
jgi:hypothetical protein